MRKIIAELGLRYRPNDRTDLEAHAARIALLTTDVAHIAPRDLEKAARAWAVKSPYMPKASELIALAKTFGDVDPAERYRKKLDLLPEMNRKLAQSRTDCVWALDAAGEFHLKDL